MTTATQSKLYTNGQYLTQNPTWDAEDSPWKAAQIQKMLKKHNLQPTSICEVGCGAGEILTQLQKNLPKKTNLTGYDISPQAIKLAQPKQNDHLKFKLEDFANTDNATDCNLLLAIDVVEHVEDLYGFLKSLHSKAKYKIFQIPLDLSAQTVLREKPILANRKKVGHIHYFTKETALATLKDAGYQIVDNFYTGSLTDRSSKSIKNKLAKLPRKLLFKIAPDFTVRLLGGYSLLVLAK